MYSIFLVRLRFQLWRLRRNVGWQKSKENDEYKYDLEEDEAADAEFDREFQVYLDAEPQLDPQQTMMFYARKGEKQCNALRKKHFQTNILLAYYWSKEHGINHFIVDPTSPFGLLALETLLEQRKKIKNLHVYTFQSVSPDKRKSYRLLPETEQEYLALLSEADYRFHILFGHTKKKVVMKAGTFCSECGIWFSKRLPDDFGKTGLGPS